MPRIQGIGPDTAQIAIVSDYPTLDEITQQTALVGKAGDLINRLLKVGNERLENCYRTCLIKTEADGVRTKNKKIRNEALRKAFSQEDWLEVLQNELNTIKPNVIISLGELSLNYLTGEKGIYKFRGSILQAAYKLGLADGYTPKIVPTLHPREIWENYPSFYYVAADYKKALKYKQVLIPFQTKQLVWVCKTFNSLQDWWNRSKKGSFLTFDIETWCGVPTCISFCVDGFESVSTPLVMHMKGLEQALTWKLIAEILASTIPKIGQNVQYDRWVLEKFGFQVNNIIGDTMLLGHTLYPELPKNLGFYTSLYTEQPYFKDEGKDFSIYEDTIEQLFLYNAKDSLATWQVWKGMLEDAEELNVKHFFFNNVMPLFHIYCKSNKRGIRVDITQRNQLIEKYNLLAQIHQTNLDTIYGRPLNIQSPKQVGEFVYEFLECPKITHATPAGKEVYSTEKEVLEELYINRIHDAHIKKILKEIIVLRKLMTILGHLSHFVHPDERLRTTVRLEGTKSGRTSNSFCNDNIYYIDEKGQLKYKEYGCLLQTIPKRKFEMEEFEDETFGEDIPSIFIPSERYTFVEGDGSAAEARVVCVLSIDYDTLAYMNKTNFIVNQFGMKDDIHVLTAQWTTEKKFEEITEIDREQKGKRPRHAGNYDMGAYRLMQMIHIPLKKCEEVLERFHHHASKIRAIFHEGIRSAIYNKSHLITPHGRRRDFLDRKSNQMMKECFSFIPQAVVSDHTKLTMPLILEDLPEAEFLVEKHDSLLAEVPNENVAKFCELMEKHYIRPINFNTCSLSRDYELVIPVEIKTGQNWLEMKKWK